MASTTEVRDRIDISLDAVAAEAEFLPGLASFWDEETLVNKDVWLLEWRDLMMRLEKLDEEYRSGRMTPDQQARYRRLLRKLSEATPIIERLELYPPPIPLEPQL